MSTYRRNSIHFFLLIAMLWQWPTVPVHAEPNALKQPDNVACRPHEGRTNQLRIEGQSINQALLNACPIRMRPVLMTSLTIILALLPAALGLGAGAETNGPLSVAVIGGMISSTLLTLVVVPAVYSLAMGGVDKFEHRHSRLKL